MLTRIAFIAIIIYSGLACCRSKSSRPSFSEEIQSNPKAYTNLTLQEAVALVRKFSSAKQYDSISVLVHNWTEQKINENKTADAVRLADSAYTEMLSGSHLQKRMALDLYEKRAFIEKDTAALRMFYSLFTDHYAYDFYIDTYDQEYIRTGEYFIGLQDRCQELSRDALAGFKESIGIGYNVAGDLKKAVSYYREVLDVDLGSRDGDIGGSVTNFCTALIERGLYDSVISFTGRLMRNRAFPHYYLAALHTTRAEAFLRKRDLPDAITEAKKALATLPKLSGDSLLKRTLETATMQAEVEYVSGNFRQSIDWSDKAVLTGVPYLGTYRDRVIGKILLLKGAAYRQLQQPDSAVKYFHQALYAVANVDSAKPKHLPAPKDIYAENTMMDALDSLALVWDDQYTKTGNMHFAELALQARKLAFTTEKKLLEAFSYDEAMQDMLRQSKKRSEKALANCYALWQKEKKNSYVQEALLLNENSKAIVLLHSVKRNNVLKSAPGIDSAVQPLNRIRYELIMLERGLAQATDAYTRDSISVMLEKKNREFLELESQLNFRYPSLKRTGTDTGLLAFDHLRKNILKNKTCLLQYFVTGTGAFVLWLDDKGNSGMEYLPATALQTAGSFLQQCRDQHGLFEKNRNAFFELADNSAKAILPAQVREQMKNGNCNNLVVIPDGIFSILPFEALSVEKNEFLVKKIIVSTASSLSTLLLNSGGNKASGTMSVFTPFSEHGFHQRSRLPFTKKEATAIAGSHKGVVVFDDTAASIRHFNQSLQQDGIIHIASHAGLGEGDDPRIYFSDSILYMSELYASGTNANLVVLSGCETGLGTLDPNEGPLSLSRAFYYAGAGNVINSLWQIDDAATADIFKVFYERYVNENAGDALRKAKLEYLEKHSGNLSAPYYWAGVVHTGLDNKKENNANAYQLAAGIILIVMLSSALLLYLRNRRKKKQ